MSSNCCTIDIEITNGKVEEKISLSEFVTILSSAINGLKNPGTRNEEENDFEL
ncbi:MAG TPA: hypothetical protein VH500_17955 [Nitrososphaeraceae archaeon]